MSHADEMAGVEGGIARPADLSADWLTAALRGAGRLVPPATVTRVDLEAVGAKGFSSQVARLRIGYQPPAAGPPSVIAKLPSAEPSIRALMAGQSAYEREARFYAEIAPAVPLRVPECVLSAPAAGGPLLLLEDLAPARRGDQLAGCSAGTAATILEDLARFHAATWNGRGRGAGWLPRFDQGLDLAAFYSAAWPAFRANFAAELPPWMVTLGARFGAAVGEVRQRLATPPRTLVHGDLRLENLFFDLADGAATAVIDWQTVSRGRGMFDVAYLLAGNLRQFSRDAAVALVRGYHRRLESHGVDDYDVDRCLEDHRWATLFLLARTVITGARPDLAQGPARERFLAVLARGITAFEAMEVAALLDGPGGQSRR